MENRTYASRVARDPDYRRKNIERATQSRRNTKLKLLEHFGNKCCKCGYDKCIAALEFHHPDPSIKESKVIGTSASFEKQKVEAEKCILLCANCHREEHFNMENYHS